MPVVISVIILYLLATFEITIRIMLLSAQTRSNCSKIVSPAGQFDCRNLFILIRTVFPPLSHKYSILIFSNGVLFYLQFLVIRSLDTFPPPPFSSLLVRTSRPANERRYFTSQALCVRAAVPWGESEQNRVWRARVHARAYASIRVLAAGAGHGRSIDRSKFLQFAPRRDIDRTIDPLPLCTLDIKSRWGIVGISMGVIVPPGWPSISKMNL